MDEEAYSLAAEVEERHWWFRGRRAVLRSVLDRFCCIAGKARGNVLEVGCGNGGNLQLLARYGQLYAAELDDGARARAQRRNLARLEKGWLPDGIPFEGERFDLIAALDVIEHVKEDRDSVRALAARLNPGGQLVVTVPAYAWLWSRHDTFTHHYRRYTRKNLIALVESAGLEVSYSTYFNTLLFPVAVLYIMLGSLAKGRSFSALKLPPMWMNRVLQAVFSLERWLLPRWHLPVGVSILVCARRAA